MIRLLPYLLQPSANGGDALRVETEPMHASDITRVLDFDAAVHDHRQAALLGDPGPLLVDHAKLAPQSAGVNLDRFLCNRRKCIRRTKDVDDVNRHRHVNKTLE